MDAVDRLDEDKHQDDRRDHDLVGDRIEKDAEPRHRPLGPGDIAVEIVGNAHQAVEREGERIIEPARHRPQQERQDRHREDARQGKEIGERKHGWASPLAAPAAAVESGSR